VPTFENRQSERAEMSAVTQRLVCEYAGQLPADSVIRCVARSREHLLRAGIRQGLTDATEAMAHALLRELVPAYP
jgi:hypothetical protein